MRTTLPIYLCAVALLSGGCRPASSTAPPSKTAKPPSAQELAECSRQMRITIPASASAVRFRTESGGPDSALWLQLRVPAADFPQFIASSPIPASELRTGDQSASVVLSYFRDWLPVRPTNFKYAEPEIGPGRHLKCLFDFDDPQTTVAYLMWFTT